MSRDVLLTVSKFMCNYLLKILLCLHTQKSHHVVLQPFHCAVPSSMNFMSSLTRYVCCLVQITFDWVAQSLKRTLIDVKILKYFCAHLLVSLLAVSSTVVEGFAIDLKVEDLCYSQITQSGNTFMGKQSGFTCSCIISQTLKL